VIAYTDDHNDFDGHTYVTGRSVDRRQRYRRSRSGRGTLAAQGDEAPATPQVIDFAQDVQVGLLGVVPVNDPLDILSVAWSCEDPSPAPLRRTRSW